MKSLKVFAALAIIIAVILANSIFTVKEWEKAIMFRLGEVVRTEFEPGLHFKLPLVNNYLKFDGRIQTLDSTPERYLTNEKKNLIVDSFLKWRISDVSLFFTTMGGSIDRANLRLSQIVRDGLRAEFGKRTIQEVVSGERRQIMEATSRQTASESRNFGIEIIDVRLKRIELQTEVRESVYQRMNAERTRIANQLRSEGSEESEKIRANADRERVVILSNAQEQSQIIRGKADATALQTYAKAHNLDPSFYEFYRSLEAYREVFSAGADNRLILDTQSDFFRFFGNESTPQ